MASDTVTTKQSKVTLTNWERLNNAPLPLAGASAVQWNDHMFVLAQDGITLLYHVKSNIWSMLPKSPYASINNAAAPPALTLHNDQIFTMSERGQVAIFNPRFGKWNELNDMNMKMHENYDCVLASYNRKLYAIVALMPHQGYSFVYSHTIIPKDCCTIYVRESNSKWKKVCEFGQGPLQSAAIVDGTAFVHTGGEMYKVFLEKKQERRANQLFSQQRSPGSKQPASKSLIRASQLGEEISRLSIGTAQAPPTIGDSPTKIASPPYLESTLYGIKDTLFSLGGRDEDNQPTSDVLRYNPDTDTWESAGYMRSARYNVAVTTMQDSTLDVLVVGGSFGSSQHTMKQQQYSQGNKSHSFQESLHWLGLSRTSTSMWDNWGIEDTGNNLTSILEKCTAVN